MVNPLACLDPLKDLRLLVPSIRRNNDVDRLADHSLGGPAEYPFGAAVP